MRSLLFVPADSERKLAKAQSAGADALILDLEDSVTGVRKPIARGLAADYLKTARDRPGIWVRINDRGSGLAEQDLAAVIPQRPAGIVLPKIEGPRDIELVAQRIVRYAEILGRENVMGGTDCGFGTFAGFGAVYPDIAWLKLKSLADGAKIASEKLWGKAGSAN